MTATRSPAATGSRRWVFWIFLALAVMFLAVEHRAHLFGDFRWLLLAVLLLCPLMHVFMHKGHGGQAGHGHGANVDDTSNDDHGGRGKPALTDQKSDTRTGGH